MLPALYILFCLISFAVFLYSEWEEGYDIKLSDCLCVLLLSVLPLLNVVLLVVALYYIVNRRLQHLDFDLSDLNIVVIKGKRENIR